MGVAGKGALKAQDEMHARSACTLREGGREVGREGGRKGGGREGEKRSTTQIPARPIAPWDLFAPNPPRPPPLPGGMSPLFTSTRIIRVSLKRRMLARSGEADPAPSARGKGEWTGEAARSSGATTDGRVSGQIRVIIRVHRPGPARVGRAMG